MSKRQLHLGAILTGAHRVIRERTGNLDIGKLPAQFGQAFAAE